MCSSTLCAHLSIFTSSMTPSSPLPAQQQLVSTLVFIHVSIHFMYVFVSLYILHDTFFTTTCTTTGGKFSCFYACFHHFMYAFVSLCILHDTFFTTTFKTTASKYFCFYSCVQPIYVCTHLSLFTSCMTPSSLLPAQQQSVSTLVFIHVSIQFTYVHICLSLHPPLHLLLHYLHNNS